MNTPLWLFRTAVNHLIRGGQRALVAWLCIAFGSMSLVSMSTLSASIEEVLVVEPRGLFGADITMERSQASAISPEDLPFLGDLVNQGKIDQYTLVAYSDSLVYHLPDSGEFFYPTAGLGIDPAVFPLAGELVISDPGNVGLPTLLQRPGDILITRDLAIENHFVVGDTLILSDLSQGPAVSCHIQGIISDTPNHQGSKIYYTMDTARELAVTTDILNTALLTSTDPQAVVNDLQEHGWQVYVAAELAANDDVAGKFIQLSINGAGILGLFVGGIGIANTMQVLINRRRKEIAVLKTIGYRPGHLLTLYGLEASLLGLSGCLFGLFVGVGVSFLLVDQFSKITTLLIHWELPLVSLLASLLVGFSTTVIFAMFGIASSSRVQPLSLLRNEAVRTDRLTIWQTAGLWILLAVPLTLVSSLVMGSILSGFGIILLAALGLVILGGILWILVRVVSWMIPLNGNAFFRMARVSLKRRGASLVFGMVALFIGVVSLAMGVVVTENARRVIDEKSIPVQGGDITIIASADQAGQIQAALDDLTIEHLTTGTTTAVQSIQILNQTEPRSFAPVLIGRSEPAEYTFSGAAWGSRPEGVYVSQFFGVDPGTTVEVTFLDGRRAELEVVGNYSVDFQGYVPSPGFGLVMSEELSRSLAGPQSIQFFLDTPLGMAAETSENLGKKLPDSTVVNLHAYAARFSRVYQNLFVFAVAMAVLALLSGALLVANAVSLAMLDRRYEIGILKSVGFTTRQVLSVLMVEYGLVALISSLAGLLAVWLFLGVLALVNPLAASLMVMPPQSALMIGSFSVLLTLTAVFWITWKPTHVSPAVVLNDRD